MRLYIYFVFLAVTVASVLCEERYVDLGSVHCKVGCACSQDYIPICANDRRTYANECTLRCKQCEIPSLRAAFAGRCEDYLLLAPVPYSYTPSGATTPTVAAPAQERISAPAPAPAPNSLYAILPQWYYYRPYLVV